MKPRVKLDGLHGYVGTELELIFFKIGSALHISIVDGVFKVLQFHCICIISVAIFLFFNLLLVVCLLECNFVTGFVWLIIRNHLLHPVVVFGIQCVAHLASDGSVDFRARQAISVVGFS